MPWFSFKSATNSKARHKELLEEGGKSKAGETKAGETKAAANKAGTVNTGTKDDKKKSVSKKGDLKEQDLQFYTQLAHGGSTKRINTFMSLKDLYTKLAIELEIDIRTIMFCTLNTPKIEMRNLLSGLVVYNDFIFVHVQGASRQISFKKVEKSIGITITDNSMGCCFVKRVRPGSVAEKSGQIHVGDQLCKLADLTLVGSRHYAVAQKLKDVPVGQMINLTLVEPKQGFDSNLSPRRAPGNTATAAAPVSDAAPAPDAIKDGTATVRIKQDGTVQETVTCSWLEQAKLKVDDLLESYMGIRDLELACTILETSDDNFTKPDFTEELNQLLGDFDFPEDFITNVWTIIETERNSSGEPQTLEFKDN